MSDDMSSGTGGGLQSFLDWTMEKSELNRSTASSLKTACKNVMSVEEDGGADLDLRALNVEDLLRRFEIKYRSQYTEKSLTVYRQRFQQAVNMYLAYLDGGDWRPRRGRANGGPRTAATKRTPGSSAAEPTTPSNGTASSAPAAPAAPPPSVLDPGLIEYPFPIRPGVRARLALPEDLTPAEADRLAAHIKTLAFDTPAD